MMKEKIGQNLQLLGSEVNQMVNKEKECKPSQESQTDITSEHIYYQTEDKQDENTLIDVQQSQHQVTEEIEQIHTNLKTITQTTIEHNPTTGQMIQPPIETTTSEKIVLPNQQQVIAQIHQELEQSNFMPQCIQMVGYAEAPQQYITPKTQRKQASATWSQAPQDDLLSSHESSVLTNIIWNNKCTNYNNSTTTCTIRWTNDTIW